MFILGDFSKEDRKLCEGKNAMYTVDILNEMFKHFTSTDTYRAVPTISLSEDKEKNFNNLYSFFKQGGDLNTLALTVLKTYIENDQPEKALKNLKLIDNRVANPQEVVFDFLNAYILKSDEYEGKKLTLKRDVYKAIYDAIINRLSETFPAYIYLDLSKSNIAKGLVSAFQENGYERVTIFFNKAPYIFKNKNDDKIVNNQNRAFFIDAYKNLVDKYVANFYAKLNVPGEINSIDEEQFERIWNVYAEIISDYENQFTEEERKELLPWIEKTKFLFEDNTHNNLYSNLTNGGNFGEFGLKVSAALSNVRNNKSSDDDYKTLNDFLGVMREVKKALKVNDKENGRYYNYPANYFKICDMNPPQFYYCSVQLVKLIKDREGFIKFRLKNTANEDEKQFLKQSLDKFNGLYKEVDDIRQVFLQNFNWAINGNSAFDNNVRDKAKDLTSEQIMEAAGFNGTFSLTNAFGTRTKEYIAECGNTTIEYMKKHSLPTNNLYCAATVFKSLVNGRPPLSEEYASNKTTNKDENRAFNV